MPRFVAAVVVPAPVMSVFEFFRRPANLVAITPPTLQLQLENTPAELQMGSRLTLVSRRWGLKQRSVTEVIVFEPNVAFVEEQKEGVFRQWVYAHHFEPTPAGGTRVRDEIDYELPGGMLGLMLTAGVVESELRAFFQYRDEKLGEMWGGAGE